MHKKERSKFDVNQYIVENELRSLDDSELTQKLDDSKTEISRCRTKRKEYNVNLREHLDARNIINSRVAEIIEQVNDTKRKREEIQSKINLLKERRGKLDAKIKETKKSNVSINDLKMRQNKTHREILLAVEEQSIAHETILEVSGKVQQLQKSGSQKQELVVEARRIAGEWHTKYVHHKNLIHACKVVIRERKDDEKKQN